MKTTELFMDAITDQHSPCIDCQFCKRTHFAREDDNYEKLCELAKQYPDKYLESDDDVIAWGLLDGRQYVWRCPCDSGARYEAFILRHRKAIATYLKRRAEEQASAANDDLALTRDLI